MLKIALTIITATLLLRRFLRTSLNFQRHPVYYNCDQNSQAYTNKDPVHRCHFFDILVDKASVCRSRHRSCQVHRCICHGDTNHWMNNRLDKMLV